MAKAPPYLVVVVSHRLVRTGLLAKIHAFFYDSCHFHAVLNGNPAGKSGHTGLFMTCLNAVAPGIGINCVGITKVRVL